MRKMISISIILFAACTLLLSAAGKAETPSSAAVVKISAETIGPGPVPITRADNLKVAAQELEKQGVKLDFHVDFSTQKFGPYRRSFSLAYSSGQAPDILGEDQDILPEYADNGMILPLDSYIKAPSWSSNYKDFFPGMWDAVSWKGKTYGIPIEAVVNNIYYRKDVLRKLGMSDEQIQQAFDPTSPKFTLDNLVRLAEQAKAKGLVEWGFTHRKGAGDYWFNSVMMFGGKFVDQQTGNMIIDTPALRKDFAFHKMLVDKKLLPSDMGSWDWKVIHEYSVDGKTLFWIGGHTGQWKEWETTPYSEKTGTVSEAYLEKNMGIAPFPGVNGPVTPVKVHAYTIVSTTKHPDIAFKLISLASSPELLAKGSITTFRGPTRESVADLPLFKNQHYLMQVLGIMKYSRAFPKNPALSKYSSMLFEAMSGVETGRLTVDQALQFMVAKAKSDIPGVIIQ